MLFQEHSQGQGPAASSGAMRKVLPRRKGAEKPSEACGESKGNIKVEEIRQRQRRERRRSSSVPHHAVILVSDDDDKDFAQQSGKVSEVTLITHSLS